MAKVEEKNIILKKVYKGLDAMNVEAGTLLKVIDAPIDSNLGEVILRLDCNERPFVSLFNGSVWGDGIEKYTFEKIDHEIVLTNE